MAAAGGADSTTARVEELLAGILSAHSRPDYVRPVRPWKPHPAIAPLDSEEKPIAQLVRRLSIENDEKRYVAMDLLPKTMQIVQDNGMYDWFCRSQCTGLLQVQAAEIKAKSINWQSYLQEQFRLTAAEAQVIRRCALSSSALCTYAAAADAWSRTLLPATAPTRDLTFVNALCTYPYKELSRATVPVFDRYL
ncbi:hypothetical protein FJT64_020471 [Amphibalanus amphitrite]|uniref:Uncharacterized protein n=1 Tax=Amphibalanus amphitrite TaxID=1232801 RepID=A0A6A4X1Q8_AMPAM|nr:hypothetical protein FJT64_005835 [Amphibalanus amphitrite]KAF0308292.1 hypothetical protein FJT64_020471 [Amphibalanus amphitrite]